MLRERDKVKTKKPITPVNYLRTVDDDRAFHFYRGIDSPLNLTARSLEEFRECLKQVEPASVEFHTQRNDFVNWINMLGDEVLAKQLASLENQGLPPEELKQKTVELVRMRVGRLRKSSAS